MPTSANQIPRYRRFINARDKALERIHISAQGRVTQALADALQRVYDGIAARHLFVPNDMQMTSQGDNMTKMIGQLIDFEFATAQRGIVRAIQKMRRNSYLLANAGEAEAIGRVKGTPSKVRLTRHDLLGVESKPFTDADLSSKVGLALHRLKAKIVDAVAMARVLGEDTKVALQRVKDTFPKLKVFKKPKRALTPLKEANQGPTDPFTFGFIDPQEWKDMVDDYLDPYHPEIRDPELYFDVEGDALAPLGIDEGEWMGWEIEQQLTNDFVDTVRQGQNDAANENGIDDVVWITVFGANTCDSCKWRNGLTSSEIEAKLEDEYSDDDFDETVPPAHPSCRCQLAPMIDEVGDAPKDLGDFSEWLT